MAGVFTHNGNIVEGLPSIASQINYSNTSSGMQATQVQAAIDELNTNKQPKTDNNLTTTSKETTGAINEINSNIARKQNISLFTSAWAENLTVPQGMCTLIMSAKTNTNAIIWSYNSYNENLVDLTGGSNAIPVTKNDDNTITITNNGGVVCALVFGQ